MSFNKSNNSSSGELSEQVVTPLRTFRQFSPPSNENIQSLSYSPLLDDQQVKASKKIIATSDFEKQMARRRELELWRQSKKKATTTTSNSNNSQSSNNGTTTRPVQGTPTTLNGQITSPFSSNQRLRRIQNPNTVSNTNNNQPKPTTLGTQKLLFSELSPRRIQRIPESRKRKSVTEQQQQHSINPPPKKPLTNNASSRINKPEIRNNVQPISRPVSNTKIIPIKNQNETNQLNLSSILIVEDKTLFEEDKHMLDNIVKITDSLDKEPIVQKQTTNLATREMPILVPTKIEESKTSTSFVNEPSILLDVSYTGSEPRSARKSMKQKSFVSNPANSVAFSPLINKTKSLTASLLTPLNTMESMTKGGTERSLFEFSLLDDSKPTRGASQFLSDLSNPTNLSSLTKTINLNTSISNDLDQLKLKILELEENLKKEKQEKELWIERYKNILRSNQTNTSLLSKSYNSQSNTNNNHDSFQTEIIKR